MRCGDGGDEGETADVEQACAVGDRDERAGRCDAGDDVGEDLLGVGVRGVLEARDLADD